MNERDCTTWLMKELAKKFPGAEITKYCDRFTRGIPDLSISIMDGGGTGWVEVKCVGKNGSFRPAKKDFDSVQNRKLQRLGRAGPAAYAIFIPDKRGKRMVVMSAEDLRAALEAEQEIVAQLLGVYSMLEADLSVLTFILKGARGDIPKNWWARES